MRRRILMLAVAFVLAMLSAVAVVAYARTADRRAIGDQKGTWVLLATAKIPSGTTGAQIRSKRLVRQVLMPAQAVPSGALSKLDSTLDDKAINAELQPDQMLLSRQFEAGVKATPKPTATFKVPADRLAVSVELGVAPQVAGNVKRGDRVTVFVTVPRVESEINPQKTWVVLPQVTVLAVGESALPKGTPIVVQPSGAAALVPTVMPSPTSTDSTQLERYVVTLAVTPAQAESLVNGYNRGVLHLGLLGASASVTAAPTVIESGPAG